MNRFLLAGIVAAIITGIPGRAAGDPINVTLGGSVVTTAFEPGRFADLRFDLTGNHGFSANWLEHMFAPEGPLGQTYFLLLPEQFEAGAEVPAFWQLFFDTPAVTLAGTTYPPGSVLLTSELSGGAFLPTVLPEVPFSILGGFSWDFGVLRPNVDPPALPIATFRGTGTVKLDFTAGTTAGQARLRGVQYKFDSQTPIPEPATVLLVTAGLSVLISRYRRRLQVL